MSRLACLALLASASAHAGPDDAARATALFDEGRALAQAGKLAEACGRFEQRYALAAATGTEVNLADCVVAIAPEHVDKRVPVHAVAGESIEVDDALEPFERAPDGAPIVPKAPPHPVPPPRPNNPLPYTRVEASPPETRRDRGRVRLA